LIDHSEAFLALRERRFDCVLIPRGRPQDKAADDLTMEILYDDKVIVAASARSKWARRRKIDLNGTDTIDDVATATGVPQMPDSTTLYYCVTAGMWYTEVLKRLCTR
jgi:DNA-binding transcriptional LysR family regulator